MTEQTRISQEIAGAVVGARASQLENWARMDATQPSDSYGGRPDDPYNEYRRAAREAQGGEAHLRALATTLGVEVPDYYEARRLAAERLRAEKGDDPVILSYLDDEYSLQYEEFSAGLRHSVIEERTRDLWRVDGEEVARLRREGGGVTIPALARVAGVDRLALQQIELGRLLRPREEVLRAIASALGVESARIVRHEAEGLGDSGAGRGS